MSIGTNFVVFHVPDGPKFLAAFGRVALRHAHLDHMLRLTIKTLARIPVADARLATAGQSSSGLRRTVRRLAKANFGEGPTLLQVYALIQRCKILTGERNSLMHRICAKELNTKALSEDEVEANAAARLMMLDENLGERPLPTVDDLLKLAQKIEQLVNEINRERLHGFVAEAMNAKAIAMAKTLPRGAIPSEKADG